MIIDFHTHTFPDKIAEKTIAYLAQKGNVTPYREGTLSSLKESMKKAGIDYSVVLPVATSKSQVESINRTALNLNNKDGIIYAGAIHPESENIEDILDGIKNAGLFGIKIHPDYQGAYFDDIRYIKIMEAAAKRDLITVTHAGFDVGYPDDIHCTPDHILNVLNSLNGLIDNKLVLAHLGSCDNPDEV
ncbi:MAG: amidohydrolase family protein, partial [Oscillospiraceae bacterium]|nr:amidohydrolase family protein [Oscillospiraceae bacterium]